jgi:hypothetical protein
MRAVTVRPVKGLLVGIATTMAVAGGASLAVADANVPICGPPRVRTMAASKVARVYWSGGMVYGCSIYGFGSYPLEDVAHPSPFEGVGPVAVAGEVAGYGLSTSAVDTVSARVVVLRLSDDKVLHIEPATTGPLEAESFQTVDDVVVKPDGAAAWIGDAGSLIDHGRQDVEVNRVDGRERAARRWGGDRLDVAAIAPFDGQLATRNGPPEGHASLSVSSRLDANGSPIA